MSAPGSDELRVVVDANSGLAPWRQVHDQIVLLIATGRLPTGSRLPTVRQLARDLGLAPGTIARAYRELEAEGRVITGRARGTVVAESTGRVGDDDLLRAVARDFVAQALGLGADVETAVRIVRAAYQETDSPAL